MPYAPCAAVVLAGGRSRRFGQDKRRLRLWGPDGPTLLEHQLQLLTPLCREVLVVMNDCSAWPQLPAHCVTDHMPGSGPLGALISALRSVQAPAALVCAVDLPCVAPALLQLLAEWPDDALVCCSDRDQPHRPQPLLARYPRRLLPDLEAAFDAGERRLQQTVAALPFQLLPAAAWQAHDPLRHSLLNLNTPADLAAVHRLLHQSPPA